MLPQLDVNSFASAMDLTMMMMLAAKERTKEQGEALLDSVGLRLVKVYTYNPMKHEAVMDVRRK